MKGTATLSVFLLLGAAFSAEAQHFYVQRQPGSSASSALPNPGLPAGVPPAYVNTPPSRAAQLQNSYSDAFLDRARAAARPSPAARFQEEQFEERREQHGASDRHAGRRRHDHHRR